MPLNFRAMTNEPDHLKAILEPLARLVDDHVANRCDDDETIILPVRVGDLRALRDLYERF